MPVIAWRWQYILLQTPWGRGGLSEHTYVATISDCDRAKRDYDYVPCLNAVNTLMGTSRLTSVSAAMGQAAEDQVRTW